MSGLCKQFTLFVIVGLLSTAFHFIVLFMLVDLLAVHVVLASSLGYLAGGIVNYLLNYHSTFHSDAPHHIAVSRFAAVAMVGFFANGLLVQLLVISWGLHYLLGQIAATLVVLVWNFLANRYWTFSNKKLDKRTREEMPGPERQTRS